MATPPPLDFLSVLRAAVCALLGCCAGILSGPAAVAAGTVASADPAPRPRVLIDYYHHEKASTRIGNFITTGSWRDNIGRYGLDDFVHTNSFDPVFVALDREFALHVHDRGPFTDVVLAGTDIVLLLNPDNPRLNPRAIVLTDEEIAALRRFVRAGGSLLVMTNGGGRDDEDFEGMQLRKLLRSFGLDCNQDDSHYSDNAVGDGHPYFYDVPQFHYGAGCTVQILPHAEQPVVLMENYSDPIYTDRRVRGPGMVLVRAGRGKVLLVGDAGSWTGNISRPWTENARVLRQLFRHLKPDRGVRPATWAPGQTLTYEMTSTHLVAVPVRNTLAAVALPLHRHFSPRPITNIPYLEATATVALRGVEVEANEAARLEARIEDFAWFDRQTPDSGAHRLTLRASRQGKVTGVEAHGEHGRWLAPDLALLSALLPVDGLRPGDRWESVETLRIPGLVGSNPPATREREIEIVYAGDEVLDGRPVRLLRSQGDEWLSDLGVRPEDLLPPEEVSREGGNLYVFLHPRGGRLIYKREQWVDAATGVVRQARLQTRALLWVHDRRRPVPASNVDKDNEMIVSLALVTNFRLRAPPE